MQTSYGDRNRTLRQPATKIADASIGHRLAVAVGASRRWRLSKPKPRRAIGPARHNRVKVSKRPIFVVYETEVLQQPPQLDGPNFHSPHHTLNYASRTASPRSLVAVVVEPGRQWREVEQTRR